MEKETYLQILQNAKAITIQKTFNVADIADVKDMILDDLQTVMHDKLFPQMDGLIGKLNAGQERTIANTLKRINELKREVTRTTGMGMFSKFTEANRQYVALFLDDFAENAAKALELEQVREAGKPRSRTP